MFHIIVRNSPVTKETMVIVIDQKGNRVATYWFNSYKIKHSKLRDKVQVKLYKLKKSIQVAVNLIIVPNHSINYYESR